MGLDIQRTHEADSRIILDEIGIDITLYKKDGTNETVKAIFEDEWKQANEDGFVIHVREIFVTHWSDNDVVDIDYFLINGKKYRGVNTEGSWIDFLGNSKIISLKEI